MTKGRGYQCCYPFNQENIQIPSLQTKQEQPKTKDPQYDHLLLLTSLKKKQTLKAKRKLLSKEKMEDAENLETMNKSRVSKKIDTENSHQLPKHETLRNKPLNNLDQ